jgi:superkiller protein 3
LNLGSLQFAQNQMEDAAGSFKKFTELAPTNAQGFANYGRVLYLLKKTDEALLAYQGALKADPKFVEVEKELGKIYLKKENYDECIKAMENYLVASPDDSYAYYAMGMAYKKKKDLPTAIAKMKQAIEKDAGNVEAVYGLANIYLEQKAYEDAILYYQKTLQANPKHYKAAYQMAIAIGTKNPDDVAGRITAWENFLKIAQKNPQARTEVGVAEEQLKALRDAKAAAGN